LFFLKASIDQFSQNLYISIINQQSSIVNEMGGGADSSSFPGEKAWGQKETFVKYRQQRG